MSTLTDRIIHLLQAPNPPVQGIRSPASDAATRLVIAEKDVLADALFRQLCIAFADEHGQPPDHEHDDGTCPLPNDQTVSAHIMWPNLLDYLEARLHIPVRTRCMLEAACSLTIRGCAVDLGFVEVLDEDRRVRLAQAIITAGGDQSVLVDIRPHT